MGTSSIDDGFKLFFLKSYGKMIFLCSGFNGTFQRFKWSDHCRGQCSGPSPSLWCSHAAAAIHSISQGTSASRGPNKLHLCPGCRKTGCQSPEFHHLGRAQRVSWGCCGKGGQDESAQISGRKWARPSSYRTRSAENDNNGQKHAQTLRQAADSAGRVAQTYSNDFRVVWSILVHFNHFVDLRIVLNKADNVGAKAPHIECLSFNSHHASCMTSVAQCNCQDHLCSTRWRPSARPASPGRCPSARRTSCADSASCWHVPAAWVTCSWCSPDRSWEQPGLGSKAYLRAARAPKSSWVFISGGYGLRVFEFMQHHFCNLSCNLPTVRDMPLKRVEANENVTWRTSAHYQSILALDLAT